MNAEIIAVGSEILLGNIVNTNAQYLSARLADLGIFVYRHTVIGDNSLRLKESLEYAYKQNDLIITTGGLGPTKDDLTKETVSEYFGKKLLFNEKSFNSIKSYFNKIGIEVSETNKKQAYFPEDSIILENNFGTAPGCIIEKNGKYLIMLPGPPNEMKPMFENLGISYLSKFINGVLESKTLRLTGIGEGNMAEQISDLLDLKNPTVAPYANMSDVVIRLTAYAENKVKALKLIEPVETEIRKRLGNFIYGINNETLEEIVAKKLIQKKLTLSIAESCSGGLLTAKLVNFPGISAVLKESVVCYSNESKINRLGVKKNTLEKFGAVSSETASEMAQGIALSSGSDIGMSITGIAGPDGGTPEKPVGLVYFGLYFNAKNNIGSTSNIINSEEQIFTEKKIFAGDRNKIRKRSAIFAIDILRKKLSSKI
ncbi:competence/damage-inducible protein A [Candidatus Dependentiae bacterium]|nr:competence/damage-inducible protein A [Candidatus Dependentiae bacterium]